MDSKVVFPKIYPLPHSYAFEESVWVNPTLIVRVDYPVKQHVTPGEFTVVWSSGAFVGPTVPSKLVRLRVGRIENVINQEVVRPDEKMIIVNAAAIWAIQSCRHATRLFLSQAASTLEPTNGVLVLRTMDASQHHPPDSSPKGIAELLGIELSDNLAEK
jgi:hypothetical protein